MTTIDDRLSLLVAKVDDNDIIDIIVDINKFIVDNKSIVEINKLRDTNKQTTEDSDTSATIMNPF